MFKRVYHFAKEEYDKLTIIMIYPNSKYDVNDDNYSLMEMLHILFKAKMTTHEKKRQLEEKLWYNDDKRNRTGG